MPNSRFDRVHQSWLVFGTEMIQLNYVIICVAVACRFKFHRNLMLLLLLLFSLDWLISAPFLNNVHARFFNHSIGELLMKLLNYWMQQKLDFFFEKPVSFGCKVGNKENTWCQILSDFTSNIHCGWEETKFQKFACVSFDVSIEMYA